METLILKIIISSFVLIAFYYLFLEKERIFKFNRIFLISALLFAYAIPFIPFNASFTAEVKSNLIIGEPLWQVQQINIAKDAGFDWIKILFIFYVSISLFFLIKFVYSIFKIKSLKGEKRKYNNQNILIIDKNCAPFSFLQTIYFSKKHIVNNQIDDRIFLHEKCHIEERHSTDILFIEFLKIFSWFNPALFFFKKAMITNHEFLADEYVLQNNYDVSTYQHLILNEIKISQNFHLTHQFDFNNTKKRFIMMTTKNSQFTWLKKYTLLPVLAILFVLFTKKVNAQTEISTAAEPVPIQNEKQDVALPINESNVTSVEKEFIEVSKNIREEFELKKDTIRKKQDVSPSTAPPLPSKFDGTLPQFPDGINALRSLVQNNFDTSFLKDTEGILTTTIYTKIDENGRMTDISAEGSNEIFNKEAERVLKLISVDKVWTPAMQDGKPVQYRFKLPLTMQFSK